MATSTTIKMNSRSLIIVLIACIIIAILLIYTIPTVGQIEKGYYRYSHEAYLISFIIGIAFCVFGSLNIIIKLFATSLGKSAVYIDNNLIKINTGILPINILWNDIKNIEYIDSKNIKIFEKHVKGNRINIYYRKISSIKADTLPKNIRKVLGIYESPYVIKQDWMFYDTMNEIYGTMIKYMNISNKKT